MIHVYNVVLISQYCEKYSFLTQDDQNLRLAHVNLQPLFLSVDVCEFV